MTEKTDNEKTIEDEKIKDKDADASDRTDDELEEGLEESVPASDPPAATQPGHDRPEPDHKGR